MRQEQNSALLEAAIPEQQNIKTASAPVEEPAVTLTDEEINRIGKEKYEQKFAGLVNTEENQGKFFLLNTVTDEYKVGERLALLLKEAQSMYSGNNFYVCRIGREALYRVV